MQKLKSNGTIGNPSSTFLLTFFRFIGGNVGGVCAQALSAGKGFVVNKVGGKELLAVHLNRPPPPSPKTQLD